MSQRDDFEILLNNLFKSLASPSTYDLLTTLATNDQILIFNLLTNYLRAEERINFYLTEYDNAPNQPSKDAVIGSVVADLGNASVDPEAAIKWPGSGGLFGNAMS